MIDFDYNWELHDTVAVLIRYFKKENQGIKSTFLKCFAKTQPREAQNGSTAHDQR